jgi:hypothetical protein
MHCLVKAIHILEGSDNSVWSNDGMMIKRGKLKNSEKALLQCHFFRHESHMKSRGIEPEAL